jgi:hypothetical protein
MAAPAMFFPAIVMNKLEKTAAFIKNPWLKAPVTVSVFHVSEIATVYVIRYFNFLMCRSCLLACVWLSRLRSAARCSRRSPRSCSTILNLQLRRFVALNYFTTLCKVVY